MKNLVTKAPLRLAALCFLFLFLVSCACLNYYSRPPTVSKFHIVANGRGVLSTNLRPPDGQSSIQLTMPVSRQYCAHGEIGSALPGVHLKISLYENKKVIDFVDLQLTNGRILIKNRNGKRIGTPAGLTAYHICMCRSGSRHGAPVIKCSITIFNHKSTHPVRLSAEVQWAREWGLRNLPALELDNLSYNTLIWWIWFSVVSGLSVVFVAAILLFVLVSRDGRHENGDT